MPITATMVSVTTGGTKRSMRLTSGAIRLTMNSAPMMAPKSARAPSGPGTAFAVATLGPTDAKVTPSHAQSRPVTPIITGSLTPNQRVKPSDWISVTMPQQNRSA